MGNSSIHSPGLDRKFCDLTPLHPLFPSYPNFHLACRSTARLDPAIASYHTLTKVPSSNCTVLGYPKSPPAPSPDTTIGSDQVRPWSVLRRLIAERRPAVAVGHQQPVVVQPQQVRGQAPHADRLRFRPGLAPVGRFAL